MINHFVLYSLLSLISLVLSGQNHISRNIIKNADSTFCVSYFENSNLIKKYCFDRDGLRDGLSEEWYYDQPEYFHITYLYSQGVLKEISFYSADGILYYKTGFDGGKEKYHQTLSAAKSILPDKLYYIKQVNDGNCSYWQYEILNDTIVKSTYFNKK